MHPASTWRAASSVFGQLYVSAAVLAFAALFVPLWIPGEVSYPPLSSIVRSSLKSCSLWRGGVVEGEGIAVVAALLVLVLVALAIVAAGRLHSFLPPVGLLVLGLVAIVLLLADPGSPSAAVTGPGSGMLWGAALAVVCTSAVHVFRTTSGARR